MNYKISKAAASLSASLTLAIDAKAKAMKAATFRAWPAFPTRTTTAGLNTIRNAR